MNEPLWDFTPPPNSDLQDREISQRGSRLANKRIALILSGSIAAYRSPDLIRDLRREGAEVQVFATTDALRYVAQEALEWTSLNPVLTKSTPNAEHLNDNAPFSAFLVAPATYNLLNKFAQGIADDLPTALLASALGRAKTTKAPILVVPTMHGSMHNQILQESLRRLHNFGVTVIPPRQENGKNNLPDNEFLMGHLIRSLGAGTLKGCQLMITGGPTPVWVDHVRLFTNRFTGALAIEIAKQAWSEQATVLLILGQESLSTPSYLPHQRVVDFSGYREQVSSGLEDGKVDVAIFSAAVADYQPSQVYPGKLPSGRQLTLSFEQTPKVIRSVRAAHPKLKMVTFKYEENRTHEELIAIARQRAEEYQLVVANRGEEFIEYGDQVAWLVEGKEPEQRVISKPAIAKAVLDRVASWL
jgi:phosphopantothenoylcysteine decarboxylase/phosphopantothenate--cysteine ligase